MSLDGIIAGIFEAELGIPASEVTDDLRYGEAPEWDSSSHMVITLALEEHFGIEFDPDEVVELSSVAAIKRCLRDKGIDEQIDG